MLVMNTALRNHLIGALRQVLITDDGELQLWAGPIPPTPDSATTGGTLLAVIDIGSLGTPAAGAITGDDVPWGATGNVMATGTASYFRIVAGNHRIQGNVGITPSFDLQVGNTQFVEGADFNIVGFMLAQGV